MPEFLPFGVTFRESVDFLRDRAGMSEGEWRTAMLGATIAAEHAVNRQFEAMHADLLKAIAELLETGGTIEDFRRDYADIVTRHGWSVDGDPGWHARLIFRTQTAFARAAGWWRQAQKFKRVRPFIRYVTAGDHRVRDNHAAWHGVILPVDHWFWLTHWPPNGFQCRCRVTTISTRQLARRGWSVTSDSDPVLAIPPDEGFAGNSGIAWSQLTG